MVLPAAARVDARLLADIAELHNLGELHLTLAEVVWRPNEARAEREREVRDECDRLGWLDRRGRLDVEVETTLRVLCRAATEFYGWVSHRDDDAELITGVVAAAIGREAVLAMRQQDTVWLSQIPNANELAETLVYQLPDVRPADVSPLRVSTKELAATSASGRTRAPGGVAIRRASPEARQIRQIMDLPVRGSGELYAGVRDSRDRYLTSEYPLRYADTDRGRYRARHTPADGVIYLDVGPGTDVDLIRQLRELHEMLTR
ncbi:ESAT-6 protein secretion system EspG family protein [Herbihabitans rhizosphaerae]|uniref:ESAT-6 protein secretion system EspG family protein n=1 Tax=Herbihabitans rhizosphaerae TaxID=1872711 RepID=A0A4Q7L7J9_9PSEU|nr:ESX secretion-associated protein EspG [Herbihabitans rhizosphaerae]RZS44611.1 ESAT-6 protein secretion system EspG family protein [Herbihabitans rhizosphaerae]